ncbi:helix-turn-helix transcriptional regulator [Streptomyces sp. NPDC088387]|uniref:helix-turn-helix transcriptional regulator n=1 Tax=Streptomyces sp. NPDC088387 TaxID=3365859 RepID=UPI0037F32E87
MNVRTDQDPTAGGGEAPCAAGLCEAGEKLYERALRDGGLAAEEAGDTPCVAAHGLLRPVEGDPGRLAPVAPTVALPRLLRASAERTAAEFGMQERLAEAFEPLVGIDGAGRAYTEPSAITVLRGTEPINRAITDVMSDARREVLCVQPNTHYSGPRGERAQVVAMERDQALLDRGGRIRTLYQATMRQIPLILARYDELRGDAEARTLDELPDRLIVVDRTVAFVPGGGEDGSVAMEVRVPAVVTHLATAFDRLWRLATPMHPRAVQQPSLNGVTPRQHAIAGLLVEGHTDAVIADRLGMNIRTARVHIAKLAATLGSESRAQLGYLIARSGVLEREGAHE